MLTETLTMLEEMYPEKAVVFEKMSTWVVELCFAIEDTKEEHGIDKVERHELVQKYRRADILMLQDLEYLKQKPMTQGELGHLIKAIWQKNGLVILTSSISFDDPEFEDLHWVIMKHNIEGKKKINIIDV